jgi:hypothetical protein
MIYTKSKFYYGHTVTADNRAISFSEDGINELIAEIKIGNYSLSAYVQEIKRAMNEVSGGNNYEVALDRATRIITISGDNPFTLYTQTASIILISAFQMMGFNDAQDLTGFNSYSGQFGSGSVYLPQFFLQDFQDFRFNQKTASANVNQSASGLVEVVSYGNIKLMSCNIKYINDYLQPDNSIFENNPTAINDTLTFLEYLITKGRVEFIANRDDSNEYVECILDSTSREQNGTAFELRELYSQGLNGYFETGLLKFRKIEEI